MSEPDGVMTVESGGDSATIRYFETSGIPKSANLEITDNGIGINGSDLLGVGISHQSNVPAKVLEAFEKKIDGEIDTVETSQAIAEKLEETDWEVKVSGD